MTTAPAPITIIRPKVLACPAATKERLTLPRRRRSNTVTTVAVMVPQLSPPICRLVEARANHADHDLPPAA